jgi:protease-4
MGDYAASGGYYISCAANKIFAQKNTITGSIGVFGMIPNVSKLLKDKAGIYTDTVNTNRFSDLGGIYRNYTDKEKAFIQASVENVYDVFITRVSEGRNISKSQVDSIGQGRVWSGMEGKNIGLVDAFGGIKEAVEEAAKLANTKQFNLIEYPEYKSIWTKFLGNQTSQDDASVIIKLMNNRELKDAYKTFGMIKKEQKGIWAWWPYQVRVN